MNLMNRQWLLARRPDGPLSNDNFEYRELELQVPQLQPGEILVQSLLFRCTPAMRTMMKANSQFMPPMTVGEPVVGSASARVIQSANPDYPVGCIVSALTGWQDYVVLDANKMPPVRKPDDVSLEDFEGILGGNSVTAYFGLLKIGEPQPGDTVVVSGAAGSTGSIAAQIARVKQHRVIGIAGGEEKCAWLRNECRLDAVIDYKSEDVEQRLGELCPDGVNVYFDNVGGATLDAVIENMAPFGRIALCGQISSYDEGNALAQGPKNMMRVIYWRLKLQGFLGFDYPDEMEHALSELRQWHSNGEIVTRLAIHDGFAELPTTYRRLFDGSHFGTLLLRNDQADT
ncbi:MAG: NADP-dependent oxidoreductase [Gammaproteobacteria bacterium]